MSGSVRLAKSDRICWFVSSSMSEVDLFSRLSEFELDDDGDIFVLEALWQQDRACLQLFTDLS